MDTDKAKSKVVVIVGPTASGKTSLSIKLAKDYQGEVISADSRQVYRGMDLGTGKVTKEEMLDVPHHLIDVADPMSVYTVADFTHDGQIAITAITNRGNLPIIAGGTFQYVDTLLGRMSTPAVPPNEELRASLASEPIETLYARLTVLDPVRAATIDRQNPRRLIRAIEIAIALGHVPPTESKERYSTLTLGISIDQATLHHNIHIRLAERLDAGMIAEVERLLTGGVSHERLNALGLEYRYISRYLHGLIDYDTMVKELETKIRQFAKRQYTWLKRDPSIIWVDPRDTGTIHKLVNNFL
ncbi:MAG: hypothetical protein RLZZ70_834 [Candidatus Parcubacteria bacterium]|jgi:tRNA dimethylallyltransferase